MTTSIARSPSPGPLERLMTAVPAPEGVEPATALIAQTDAEVLSVMMVESYSVAPPSIKERKIAESINDAQWRLSRPVRHATAVLVALAVGVGVGGAAYKSFTGTPPNPVKSADRATPAQPLSELDAAASAAELGIMSGIGAGAMAELFGGMALTDRAARRQARRTVARHESHSI